MSTSITFPAPDGATYIIPAVDDENWGQNVSNFLIAIPAGVPPRNGTFALTGDLSFGPSFGLISQYYKSATSNPASAGVLRLANIDAIEWRNSTNTGNNVLNLSGDSLTYNGSSLTLASLTNSHIFVGNISNTPTDVAMSGDTTITNTGVVTISAGAITNTKVASGAAIAVSKLAALTANRAVATDSSGFLTPSATTDTELGYVNGVTSPIQAQINSLSNGNVPTGASMLWFTNSAPFGWLFLDGASYTTASQPGLFALWGYTFGGAGANFNVPNMTNMVPVGAGGSIAPGIGNTAGSTTHTLVNAEMAATTVTVNITDPTHGHNILGNSVNSNDNSITLAGTGSVSIDAGSLHPGTPQYRSVSLANSLPWIQASATGITASGTVNGSATPFSIVQPSFGAKWIVKT